jgi:tetratricopeptide (TPR) repeat protein
MIDSRKHLLYRLVLITVLLLAVYGNTINHRFVWDDADIIIDNPQLEKLSNIPSLFLSEDKIEGSTGYYRPMTYVSFALDRAIWGLNPVGFNITNLLLHILVALLFYQVISTLFKNENLALAAALIFSLHPVAGETINFHSGGRNTLLCACFILLSLLFYAKEKRLVAVICFAGAIFSKEFGLLLPAILFVYDWFIKKEKPRLILYLPFLVPIVLYFTFRSYAIEKSNLLSALNFSESLWLSPYLVIKYLAHMIYPFNLSVLYDISTNIIFAALSLAGIALLVFIAYYFRKQGEVVLSISWFLLFLLPVINIVLLQAASKMADRYAYISLMGFALALAFIISKVRKEAAVAIVLIICGAYALVDITRNNYWKDDHAFYSQMIKDSPDMALGYNDLGIYYFKKGDMVNAEKYLTIAGTKKDITARLLGANAGVFWQAENFDAAEKLLLRQLELEPSNPQSYIMLKMIYEKRGNKTLAKLYGDKASALFPGIEEMMKQRVIEVCRQAESFITMHSYERAENLLREAIIINPDFVPALVDIGGVSAEKGDFVKAEKYLTRATSLEPLNASAHYNLAQVYLMQGKKAEAEIAMKKSQEADALSKQKPNQPVK